MVLLILQKKKRFEAVLVESVPISPPDNYNEANLYLAKTIENTFDQFKALIEKARKFNEDSDSNSQWHSPFQFGKIRDIVEETHTWKKALLS